MRRRTNPCATRAGSGDEGMAGGIKVVCIVVLSMYSFYSDWVVGVYVRNNSLVTCQIRNARRKSRAICGMGGKEGRMHDPAGQDIARRNE